MSDYAGLEHYINGRWCREADASISILDHGFLYGDGVFDTLFAMHGYVFKLDEHIRRFERSAKAIGLDLGVTADAIAQLVVEAAARNGLRDAYLRVIGTRGTTGEPLLNPDGAVPTLIVFVRPYLYLSAPELIQKGLSAAIVTTRRVGTQALDARIKSNNYLSIILAKMEATRVGCNAGLILDEQGRVCEGPGYNVFVVRDGAVVTPGESALEGITRATVLDLCAELGIPASVGSVWPFDCVVADELFLTSTAGGIMPVTSVDGRPVGGGVPGPVVAAAHVGLRRHDPIRSARHPRPHAGPPVGAPTMRIAIGQIWHETNTFSPHLTGLPDFERGGLFLGDAVLTEMRGMGEVGGFLEAIEQSGREVELVPILRAWAMPGGRLTDEAFRWLFERLITGLTDAGPLDAVLLALHGASAAEGVDDVEGHLLEAARVVVGTSVPVVVSLDHHANVTERMVAAADAIVGYQTEPHDPFETGVRAANLLLAQLGGEVRACTAWRKIPMLAPVDTGDSSQWPMRAWYDLARELERRPGVLSASYFPVVPWLDVAELGWSAVVVTDDDPDLAARLAGELADRAWQLRAEFWKLKRIPPAEAVARAIASPSGPVIICDSSDSVLSGAPGDGTCVLSAILENPRAGTALVSLVDPLAVGEALALGVGSQITTTVGGRLDPLFGVPLKITGRVAAISEHGLRSRIGEWGFADAGRSVLLEVGSVRLLVSEFRGDGGTSPASYRSLGVEPSDAQIIVVKTYFHFREYADIMKDVHVADCLGMSGWNLRSFPWVNAPRPLYPLDDAMQWGPG